jgi:hypothetical protein
MSSTPDGPDTWTLAHASKAVRAKQLPAWLAEKKTAALGKRFKHPRGAVTAAISECWWGQFQGQFGEEERSRNSNPVVYLGFSPR